MPIRLSKIDELTRGDHTFLEPEDRCYYLREYNSRKGYQFSGSNQLVFNLKKPLDRRGQADWKHKGRAIQTAGRELREALDVLNPAWLGNSTLVPVPPSKTKSDPLYDDRIVEMLRVAGAGLELDLRELVLQRESTEAAHVAELRPRLTRLIENYRVDESLLTPLPRVLAIVDDVLTTGAHFKAVQTLLRDRIPAVPILGLFIARRVPDPFEAL